MAEHALREWGVTCTALARGDQVMVVRKGGIGEKRFELPHRSFFLLPGYEHQRPELIKPEFHARFQEDLDRNEDPELVPLRLYAEIAESYAISDPGALEAVDAHHILSPDYAAERLRWRRTQPLWAVVLRVWTVTEPPTLQMTPELGGCVSWIDLPEEISVGTRQPVLDDTAFGQQAAAIRDALAAVAPLLTWRPQ